MINDYLIVFVLIGAIHNVYANEKQIEFGSILNRTKLVIYKFTY